MKSCSDVLQSELQSLQDRLRTIETELENATRKTNEIQQQLESERKTFAVDKKTLEETIVDMSSSAANTQADEAERASIVRLQEERITVSDYRRAVSGLFLN
jgi:nucleoprotein TPR